MRASALLTGLTLVFVPGFAHAQSADPGAPPSDVAVDPVAAPAPPPTPPAPPAPVTPTSYAPTSTPAAHRLAWDPAWPKFHPVEYVATGAGGVAAVLLFNFGPSADHAKWDSPILLDKPVRKALRQRGKQTLTDVRLVGDILTIAPIVYVLGIDSLLVPALDRNFEVLWQMEMMNAEGFALSGLLAWSFFATVGRARPSYRECRDGKTDDPLCNSGTFSDFPSGHTMSAFTAAGLVCAHHKNLPLYGGGGADLAACLSTLAVSTGAGVFRLLGDRHYVSDVVVGAGIGFAIGYGLPSLLHYRGHSINQVYASPVLKVAIGGGPEGAPGGASLFGQF